MKKNVKLSFWTSVFLMTAGLIAADASKRPFLIEGMVWIPAGKFKMGSNIGDSEDQRPVHEVALDGFWMDQTEVTNEQFAAFFSMGILKFSGPFFESGLLPNL